ncbi:phage tail assembly chaperone [Vibrio vulnificus]|uniref:phage tail assembly chaperone n=1 Tax=Vibrio vulnificus TaxID=672 RepID=UPI00215B4669|nr:phage tail assembly chaperone [Vibrio vulnificus]
MKWDDIRQRRANLLRDADLLINKCEDLGSDATLLREYRQKLRDIPQTYSNPDDVVWPEKPAV